MMKTIAQFHNFHWHFSIWLLLFLVCLFLIFRNRKIFSRGYEAFYPIVPLAILIAYCPLLANFLIPGFLPSYLEYERLTWLFFAFPIIAYVIVEMKDRIRGKARRFLFVAAALFTFFLFSQPNSSVFFTKAENIYKISDEAIEVCDIIEKDKDKDHVLACVMVESRQYGRDDMGEDGKMFYGIRQYDSHIELWARAVRPESYTDSSLDLTDKVPDEIDYYICPAQPAIDRQLRKMGLEKVSDTENFSVYRKD